MRIVLGVAAAAALAFNVAVAAQEKAPEKKAPAEHTMQGCVAKGATANTFIVNNTAPKGPKVIGILESKENLGPHVGHKIDITGTAVPNAEAEKMKNAPKADHYMRLTAIKMVSATCP